MRLDITISGVARGVQGVRTAPGDTLRGGDTQMQKITGGCQQWLNWKWWGGRKNTSGTAGKKT